MAAAAVLSLSVEIPVGDETNVARFLHERMRPAEWMVLRQFALAVTMLGESAAAGRQMVVLPMQEAGVEATVEVAGRALRLRPEWGS
jgi:imidazoleglycerol phosphate dehydratase HisB